MFFPQRGQSHRPGKAVCFSCPVKTDCEDYAQRTGSEHGLWGGRMRQRGPRT